MPRVGKRLLAVLVDIALCAFTVWLALCLRLEHWVQLTPAHGLAIMGSVLIALPLFIRFGLYRAIFRYAGWNAMVSLTQAMVLYALFYATVFTVIGIPYRRCDPASIAAAGRRFQPRDGALLAGRPLPVDPAA